MSNLQNFNSKLEVLKAMPNQDVMYPNMPIDKFLQEGENLHNWCTRDKEELIAAGLNWNLVDDLPICLGALREAQSQWISERHTRQEAGELWNNKAPEAYNLRDSLIHAFRYAYRKSDEKLGRVVSISEGRGHADMIQDLNDLSVLGKKNSALLDAIKFNAAELEDAATMADDLAELLSEVNGDRAEQNELKSMRDKAFTLCKTSIDEIRDCGKYVFWRNNGRLQGYSSQYRRSITRKTTDKQEIIETEIE